jgi:chemotaxis signal transduction protein
MRAHDAVTATTGAQDLVYCSAAGRPYAFDSRDVRLIARSDQLTPGGDAVACVGMVRAPDPIPVYSLAALLHPSIDAEGGAHVIVTGSGDGRAGWQVDRLQRGNRGGPRETIPLPALAGPVSRRWFAALIANDGREPGLVCSPSGLDPRARAWTKLPDPPPVGAALSSGATAPGAVALFSSSALPHCGVARFALSGRRLVAVVQSLAARAVPGTPSYVVAIATWRGLAVPLIDLSGRTSVPAAGQTGRHLLVRYGTGPQAVVVGIAIGRDVALHHASSADTALARRADDLPAGIRLFAVAGQPVALLDLDALIGARLASATGESFGLAASVHR